MRVAFAHGKPETIEALNPAYFALVMATGIVAIAAQMHNIPLVPAILFGLNFLFMAFVTTATVVRIFLYPDAVLADLRSHSRGMGFFTAAAAAGVFGSQLIIQANQVSAARWLWLLGLLLWMLCTYGIITLLTVQRKKPSLADGLNGGWLLSVVATQSLSILTALVSNASLSTHLHDELVFVALIFWLGGGALYLWLVTLIFFRYTFWRMEPDDLTPPYWINMGAVAISTLAGVTLLQASPLSPVILGIVPFVKGLTLFFWAIGSWWIPMLVVLGVWRYVISGTSFQYDPLYWGGVFPLGMYSACTYRLSQVIHVSLLITISYVFLIVAAIAWTAALIGLVDSLIVSMRSYSFRRNRQQIRES